MKAVRLIGHGGHEMLEWSDKVPTPQPGTHQVLIKVSAAGVNNTDLNTRVGWYSKQGAGGDQSSEDATWSGKPLEFPRIQGADICGEIVGVGDGADVSRLGERVIVEPNLKHWQGEALAPSWYIGSECDGGFAQYAIVDARYAHRVECDFSDIELASFPCSYSTAENMLTRIGLSAGERVLITGASGGVGSAAVQLAKARGAHVIAVVGETKQEALKEMGADQTIARGADLIEALGHNCVEAVVDLVAGPSWPQLLDVLKLGGRYATSGAIGGHEVTLDVRTLYLKDLSFFGCTALDQGVFAALVKRIEAGEIKPLVAATYPLQDITRAQEDFAKKNHIGKLVLQVA